MTKTLSPQRCANEITVILNSIPGYKRFPVNVGEVARELTHQKFPDDPITLVKGDEEIRAVFTDEQWALMQERRRQANARRVISDPDRYYSLPPDSQAEESDDG